MVDTSVGVRVDDHTRAGAESVKRNLKGMQEGAGQTAGAFDRLQKMTFGLGGALGALGVSMTAATVLNYAAAWQKVENQLKLVTGTADELLGTQDALFKLSQQTRSSYDATGNLYARLARSTEDLNLSQRDLLTLTGTINQAFVVSGASGQEASQAIIQLSQGFASGALRGDELNSVMEQAPRLTRALADGLGVGIGQLRKMGEAGELTSEKMTRALLGQAPRIGDEYGRMGVTTGQAFERVTNSIEKTIGTIDKLSGATATLAKTLQMISGTLDAISGSFEQNWDQWRLLGWLTTGATAGAAGAWYGARAGSLLAPVTGGASVPTGAVIGAGAGLAQAAYSQYEPQLTDAWKFMTDPDYFLAAIRGMNQADMALPAYNPMPPVPYAGKVQPGVPEGAIPRPFVAGGAEEQDAFWSRMTAFIDKTYGPHQNKWDKPLDLEPTDTFDAWKKEFLGWQDFMKEMSENVSHLLPKDFVQQRGDLNNRKKAEDSAFDFQLQQQVKAARRQQLEEEARKLGQLTEVFRGLSPEVDRFTGALNTVVSRLSGPTPDAFGAVTAGLGYVVGAMFGAKTETDRWAGAILDSVIALKQSRQAATDLTLSLPGAASEELKTFQFEAVQPLLGLFDTLRAGGPDRKFFEDFRDFTSLTESWVTKGGQGIPAAMMSLKNMTGLDEGSTAWAEIVQSVTKTLLPGGFGTTIMDSLKDAFGPDTTLQEIVLKMFDVQEAFKNVGKAAKVAVDGIGDLESILAAERFQSEVLAARGQLSRDYGLAGGDMFLQRQAVSSFEEMMASIKDSVTLARSRSGSATTVTVDASGKPTTGGGGSSGVTDPFTFGTPVAPSAWDQIVKLPDSSTRIDVAWEEAVHLTDKYGVNGHRPQYWRDVVQVPGWDKRIDVAWEEAVHLTDKYGVNGRRPHQWADIVQLGTLPRIERAWDQAISLSKLLIDDWSDILYFPKLPPLLRPIEIGVEGHPLLEHERDMIRIRPLLIDDWSDILSFSRLPALLEPIMIGVEGRRNVGLEHDRDMIRIRPLLIDDWSDILNFSALPALLSPITVNTGGDRDLIRITPATLSPAQLMTLPTGGDFFNLWWEKLLPAVNYASQWTQFFLPQYANKVSLDINSILQITGKMNIQLNNYIDFNGAGLREKLFAAVEQGIADRQIRVRAN